VWIDVRLMQAELSRVAHTDALTGLPNRRAVRVRFGEESSRAARHGQHFALAVFDIDHFKQVNDRYGHAVGDEMLKAVAAAFSSDKRGEDVLGRIGGEEFLMLVAQQSIDGAREAADRLRAAAGSVHIDVGAEKVRVTVSAGVALYPDDGQDWEHLFAVADRRLYAAKRGGRNRVEASG
ncbi:MAG: GGDEF domain-containing protein, partial [Usitatibacter sp.]